MTFLTLTVLWITWALTCRLTSFVWRRGAEITVSKREGHFLEIAHRLGRLFNLPRWAWRNSIPVWGLKGLTCVLFVLMALPAPSVLACACTDVVVNGASGQSSSVVDEYDGRFAISQLDIDIPGVLPIRLVRKYNSLNAVYGPFGFGWTVEGAIAHLENSTGDIEVNFGDSEEYFHSSDRYRNADNSLWLTFTGQSEILVQDRNGNQWYFNTIDKTLTKKRDKNGNTTTFSWNVVQKQIGVDTENNPIYQDIYCPTQITYPDGRVLSFVYSSVLGQEYLCTQVSSPDGSSVNYSYEQGLLVGVSTSAGQTLSYNYHTDSNSYRTIGWLVNITYANAGQVNVTYNGEFNTGNALRVVKISGPEGYEKNFQYLLSDKAISEGKDLNCSKCITTIMTDSLGHATTYAKDNSGRTKTITDALGHSTQEIQDSHYRLQSTVNKRGYTTTYGYANAGNTNASVLSQNLRTSMTNSLGNAWTYQYDSNGNQTVVIDPNGHQITSTYDLNRNQTSRKNGLGQTVVTNVYNASGLLVSTKNGANNETKFSYNNYGYQTNKIDPAGKSWKMTYDSAGRQLSVSDPIGNKRSYSYTSDGQISSLTNALSQVTIYSYDEMGNRIKSRDANGKEINVGYDKLQRISSLTNSLGGVTGFNYDSEGNVTQFTDALGRAYSYSYDSLNRLTAWTLPGGTHETIGYDSNGNVTTLTNCNNETISYTYDSEDRNVSTTWSGATNVYFAYNYDNANRLIGASKSQGNVTISSVIYNYNSADQVTSVTHNGYAVDYEYNAAQRMSKITYPSGIQTQYEYEDRGLISGVKDSASNIVAGYTYDDAGRLVKRTLANGLEAVFSYDAVNRISEMSLRQASNTNNVKQSFKYGYDNVGNRLWVQFDGGTGDVYKYDDTYQIIGVKYGVSNPTAGYENAQNPVRIVSYSYDAVGNRISVTDNGNITAYTKNDLNEYTAVNGVNYSYSANGDLIGDGNWSYEYDLDGHLIKASKSGLLATYSYDVEGRRIAKSVNGIITKYVYSGLDLIEERDVNNGILAQYIYEKGVDRPVKVVKGGNTYYFNSDSLNNITSLVDSSGVIVEKYSYDVFGGPRITNGAGVVLTASLTPFLFTGREYDLETGLYHYRARAYSPGLGRFLQRDRMDVTAGDVNFYRYAGNNPVNLTDFSGQSYLQGPFNSGNTMRPYKQGLLARLAALLAMAQQIYEAIDKIRDSEQKCLDKADKTFENRKAICAKIKCPSPRKDCMDLADTGHWIDRSECAAEAVAKISVLTASLVALRGKIDYIVGLLGGLR